MYVWIFSNTTMTSFKSSGLCHRVTRQVFRNVLKIVVPSSSVSRSWIVSLDCLNLKLNVQQSLKMSVITLLTKQQKIWVFSCAIVRTSNLIKPLQSDLIQTSVFCISVCHLHLPQCTSFYSFLRIIPSCSWLCQQ